jgi:hypothetical protein
MPRYAADTQVPSDRSRSEIEKTLRRYGASAFAYGWQEHSAQIMFEMANRRIKFALPLPDPDGDEFRLTPSGKWERSAKQQEEAYEQAVRQRWRALALVIKAKLEAVEAGISSVEDEFLAHVALPHGGTVGEWLGPRLDEVYASGEMPALLPGGGDER